MAAGAVHAQTPAAPAAPPPESRDVAPSPRLRVGGELSITFAPDDPHYFNYTDYEQNALRLVLATAAATYTLTDWLDAVGEVRAENVDRALLSALYARVRPPGVAGLTLAAGRVPPVFGAFARTRYGSGNPLVSKPLAYQYLSTLRSDAVPATADALLAVRGQGWLVAYPDAAARWPETIPPGGYPIPVAPTGYAAPGLPLISGNRWDTGIAGEWDLPRFTLAASATLGSLSKPRVDEDNAGKSVAARIEWRPAMALTLGASAARGAFLSRIALRDAGAPGADGQQSALAVDAAFAVGHLQARGEVIRDRWSLPALAQPLIRGSLGATATTIEVQYRVHPRVDVALRGDRIDFSSITGTLFGRQPTPWDADVARLETGASYRFSRRWRAKLAYQYNWRFGLPRVRRGYPAVQLSAWF